MSGKREERMKEITERLEQGVKELFTSEKYTAYLKTMAQFHNYSFNNTVLIMMQKPDATLVAGYNAWKKKFNRQVKRGEKGIQIMAPITVKVSEEVPKFDPVTDELVLRPDGQPETEVVERAIARFRTATVFDISQTEGDPLPEIDALELMGSVENFTVFMEAIQMSSPVPIRHAHISGESKGYYSNKDKEIVIREGMSERQTMKTAVHEVTHAMCHDRDRMEELGEQKGQMTREVEAESVAYTVCQYFGLDTSDYSFPYIAGWSSGMDMKELRFSMEFIRITAGSLIDSISENIQAIQRGQIREPAEAERDSEMQAANIKENGAGFLAAADAAGLSGKTAGECMAPQQQNAKISFYVAECMEFPVLGEYHENIGTLQEAVELYEKIPSGRMHGVKGIGFCLEDSSIYAGKFELMSGREVLTDIINDIPHYKESPLVQKAVADMRAILSVQESRSIQGTEKEPGLQQGSAGDSKAAPKVAVKQKVGEKAPAAGAGGDLSDSRKRSVLHAVRDRQARVKEEKQGQKAQMRRKTVKKSGMEL